MTRREAADKLMQVARNLRSEDGENLEYDRALCELIADTFTIEPGQHLTDAAREVAVEIDATNVVQYYDGP